MKPVYSYLEYALILNYQSFYRQNYIILLYNLDIIPYVYRTIQLSDDNIDGTWYRVNLDGTWTLICPNKQ